MHAIVRSSQICKRTCPVEAADFHMKATPDTRWQSADHGRQTQTQPTRYNTMTAKSPRRHAREKHTRISAHTFLSRITYIAYTGYVCESWSTLCGPSSPPSERVARALMALQLTLRATFHSRNGLFNCGDTVTRPGGLTGYLFFCSAITRMRLLSLYVV